MTAKVNLMNAVTTAAVAFGILNCSVVFADSGGDMTAKQISENRDVVDSSNRRIDEASAKFGAAYLKNLKEGTPYIADLEALHKVQGEAAKAVQDVQKKHEQEWVVGTPKRIVEGIAKIQGVPFDSAKVDSEIQRLAIELPNKRPETSKGDPGTKTPFPGPYAPSAPSAVRVPTASGVGAAAAGTGYTQPAGSGYVQPASTNSWGGSAISSEGIDGSGIAKDLGFAPVKKPVQPAAQPGAKK